MRNFELCTKRIENDINYDSVMELQIKFNAII